MSVCLPHVSALETLRRLSQNLILGVLLKILLTHSYCGWIRINKGQSQTPLLFSIPHWLLCSFVAGTKLFGITHSLHTECVPLYRISHKILIKIWKLQVQPVDHNKIYVLCDFVFMISHSCEILWCMIYTSCTAGISPVIDWYASRLDLVLLI